MEWAPDIGVEQVFRLLLAVMLGGVIGLERELRDKPAGFRTIVLICVGSCLFSLAGMQFASPHVDPTRVAAQVVTGMGFLGAGAILRESRHVVGLTTAATIWAVAAVGMACGLGFPWLASLGAGLILLTLLGFSLIERGLTARWESQEHRVATRRSIEAVEEFQRRVVAAGLRVRWCRWHDSDDGRLVIELSAAGPKSSHDRLRWDLLRDETYRIKAS